MPASPRPPSNRFRQDLAARGDTPGLLQLVEVAGSGGPPTRSSEAALRFSRPWPPLVPKGTLYDPYRADCLAWAGILANNAALRELGARGWIAGSLDRRTRGHAP